MKRDRVPRMLGSKWLLALLLGVCWGSWGWSQEKATWVIRNARMLESPADLQAIAIGGNRILAIGPLVSVQNWLGPETQQFDAQGASVTPGFNDAHVHFVSGCLSLTQVNLLSAQRLEEVEDLIRRYVADNPSLGCVVGRGWLYGAFPNGLPTRQQLDLLVPDRPAIMRCYDGHTVWVNSQALQQAGIDKETRDPTDGVIVRDEQGTPTGVLKEGAQRLIEGIIPKPTRSDKLAAMRQGIRLAHQLGVASIQEAGLSEEEVELFEQLRLDGALTLRVSIALEGKPSMTSEEIAKLTMIKQRFPDLHIGAVKLYADGVVESHTAALIDPYANRASRGLPECTPADMQRVVTELDAAGWQVMIHAIGDGGIRMCLDAYEHAIAVNAPPAQGRRHRLEHLESVSASDIPRLGQLGVIASMQPFHADPNGNLFNVWAVNLGPDRASRAWCWKSIQQAGGRLAFGTDWPVVGLDPRQGLHTAMTRQTLAGEPPLGFIPAQRLTLQEAVHAYTLGSSWAEFGEQDKGSIEVGKLADLVIWDQNLGEIEANEVHKASVRTLFFDGEPSE